jgi:hypothetical protein
VNVVFSAAIKGSGRSTFVCLTPELRKEMGEAVLVITLVQELSSFIR